MKNYKITVSYDGTRYKGWQVLKSTDATIQGKLQMVLSALAGHPVEVIGSGRTDAHPEAKNGFAEEFREFQIPVVFPEELQAQIPEHLRGPLLEVLAQDPRAAYNKKPDYIYGMAFDDYDIRFTVAEGILTVKEVTRRTQEWKKVK